MEPFFVPEPALAHWRMTKEKGAKAHKDWNAKWAAYKAKFADDAKELERRLSGKRKADWSKGLPTFTKENGSVASRSAFGVSLNATADALPELIGGSADLTPSNNTSVKTWKDYQPTDRTGGTCTSAFASTAWARS